MHHIGLIVTGPETAKDFAIFCKTLEVYHPDATLYVFTDHSTDLSAIKFKGVINYVYALDAYTGLSRKVMEAMPGKHYASLWTDFMYEKVSVLAFMFSKVNTGLWFMDADIAHMAPLPIIPDTATLALSPHYIRTYDEKLYGKYNGGYLWIKSPIYLDIWRTAGHTSRFYEQAAMESMAVAANKELYEFPIQVNFGWWRMYQSASPSPDIQSKFSVFRHDAGMGIRYDGAPLQSVHTHWYVNDTSANGMFNMWIKIFLQRFSKHKPYANFLRTVQC